MKMFEIGYLIKKVKDNQSQEKETDLIGNCKFFIIEKRYSSFFFLHYLTCISLK